MEEKRYGADYDRIVMLITNLVVVACMLIVAIKPFDPSPEQHLRFSILFFFIPLQFFVWSQHPRYYSLSDTSINIKKPFSTIRIPFEEIVEVRAIEWREMGTTFRLFGSGGLFGYLGIYSSSVFGRITLWCTHRNRLVMITCKGRCVVISPSDPLDFVMDYKKLTNLVL